jgi:hypothetical protein
MRVPVRSMLLTACVLLLFLAACPAAATSISDQLSAYGEDNAKGYLQPLVDAIGVEINSGLYHSANIPKGSWSVKFEIQAMALIFPTGDATFKGTTEDGFTPQQTVDAPTVVGDGNAVTVDGDGNTHYSFPGGFNVNSFALAVPQLRVGIPTGSEVLVRYIALPIADDVELGDIKLMGFGARHNLSQYFGESLPAQLSVGAWYQKFEGGDAWDATALSFGVQLSKKVWIIDTYGGFAMDSFKMDVKYDSEATGQSVPTTLNFDSGFYTHLTIGLNVELGIVFANLEGNFGEKMSFGAGIGVGF